MNSAPLPSVESKNQPHPPSENPNPTLPSEAPEFEKAPAEAAKSKPQEIEVPYTIPEWSGVPCRQFRLEVFKDGTIVDQLNVCEKGAYMFGRDDLCDFVLEHPTISRFHAVLQFNSSGDAYIFDLGSTHGTFINGNQVGKKVYQDLHVGDAIGFGHSSHLYNFRGPAELMPPDQQASLQDVAEEITWQTYKGQLTEEQTKTRDKITKRLEKIDHTKKEIDAIHAKYITQGGLTRGQQTQIAFNEQTTEQILKELESLEEILNGSIRKSLVARGVKLSDGKQKGAIEVEEERLRNLTPRNPEGLCVLNTEAPMSSYIIAMLEIPAGVDSSIKELYLLLEDDVDDMISWSSDGTSFIVHDSYVFSEYLCTMFGGIVEGFVDFISLMRSFRFEVANHTFRHLNFQRGQFGLLVHFKQIETRELEQVSCIEAPSANHQVVL